MAEVYNAYKLATSELNGRLIGPHQREGVLWLLARELMPPRHKGGFLCDEMGLGKTVQMISTCLGNPKRNTLVVVPKTIVNQWRDEVKRFAPHLTVYVHDGLTKTTDAANVAQHSITITAYSGLRKMPSVLHEVEWGRVILDEGHEIRNSRTQIFKSVSGLQSEIRWILTGTPVYNSKKDFANMGKFLGICPRFVVNNPRTTQKEYVLRRTKDDIIDRIQLPPCDFQNVECEMYPQEKKLYDSVFEECRNTVLEIFQHATNIERHAMVIMECLLRCRQVMIHPQLFIDSLKDGTVWDKPSKKLETLVSMIEQHPKEKTIVFTQFKREMEIIEKSLVSKGITVFKIHGMMNTHERTEDTQKFRACKTQCAFLIQIKAGGQGLNLQEATRVYITSPSWNPATELQAIARSHRTGQTQTVVVRKLIYAGDENTPSIDQSIMALQGHKAVLCSEVLNDPRYASKFPVDTKKTIDIKTVGKIFST